ncbi:MAG: amidohydrolase [Dehalococcoidia bacterium]
MDTEKAELILYNANVLTMDLSLPRAEMVAMRDGRVLALGRNSDLNDRRSGRTELIDCRGGTVIPGFNDAHMHIFSLISSLLEIDCSPASVSSITDIQRLVSERAMKTPHEKWIKATGYNEFYLEERRHPTRWDLDKAAPAHPVRLSHRTRHACVLNSRGLSLAGINAETPDLPGGLIERDTETGEPTGLIFGMNARISGNVVPSLTDDELDDGFRNASELLLSYGITSIQDATAHNGLSQWQQLKRVKERGLFCPRVSMMSGFDALELIGSFQPSADSGLRPGPVKIIIDEITGSLNPTKPMLNSMVLSVHQAGIQVALHAVEDSTVEAAIEAIESTLQAQPRRDHRHRIEHCSECPGPLMQRLKETGSLVVTQPAFIYFNGERYLSRVDRGKLPWLYRTGALVRSGVELAASSDAPVIPVNPMLGVYAAVSRAAMNGEKIGEDEALSPEQALRVYTMGGAYASFEESTKGSITPGKLADLVLLSADPTAIYPDEIRDIRVEKTIMNGRVVWG